VAGATVADGTITWTARTAMTITWTARDLYKTSGVEPVWPTVVGGTVVDGSVTWTAVTPAITDPKCPQSRIGKIMANKVFSPYRDVTRYCATDNPRDWSSATDAGFLPTGLQFPDAPETTAIGEFRGRGVFWTSGGLSVWTVDPDPALMALFDTQPGLGTTYSKGLLAVAGDLYFITPNGIRSRSVAAGAITIESGDVGSPIDPRIQPQLASPYEPIALNYPGSAQAMFGWGPQVFVYSRSRLGKIAAWSRYNYPYNVEATAQLAGALYFRSGDDLYIVDREANTDDGVAFGGLVETNYLDCGSPGVTKMVHGVDVVGYGAPSVSLGWDQTNYAAWTTPYLISEDTLPDGIVPIPVAGPSIAVRLQYAAAPWQLNAMNLYLQDFTPPK
jgi:hypothetical protein